MSELRQRFGTIKVARSIFIFIALSLSFGLNGFGVDDTERWTTWQSDSEAFVINRIEFDKIANDSPRYIALPEHGGYQLSAPLGLIGAYSADGATASTYTSMIGGYTFVLSTLSNQLRLSGVEMLHALNALLLAASILLIFSLLPRISSQGFAWAWLAGMAFSPWITSAGRNLYWSPWLWLLPAIAAILLAMSSRLITRLGAVMLLLLAFLLKYWATGYEIFTSVTLLAVAMPLLVILFKDTSRKSITRQLTNVLLICVTSAIAFLGTILLHAYLLTGNIASGLNTLWQFTILRRTWGAGEEWTFIEVLWRYIYASWTTPIFSFALDRDGSFVSLSIGPTAFLIMLIFGLTVVAFRWKSGDSKWTRDASLILIGLLVAISWFAAAKEHSYVHTHILFFLWYLFLIPALLFVISSYVWPRLLPVLGELGFQMTRCWQPRRTKPRATRSD